MKASHEVKRRGRSLRPYRKARAATDLGDGPAGPALAPSGIGIKIARSGRRVPVYHPMEAIMADNPSATKGSTEVTREQLIGLLNEDLAREYQAIIAYVVYSQALKGAQYMNIAAELETHAGEELAHALTISKQIDYLGGAPTVTPKPVKVSDKAEDMLRFDLDNENETVRNYRDRIRQCEALGEFALAEQIRQILVQEQEHQIDLATALGIDVPDVSKR
jgi:bacterioferritin